MFVFLAFAGSAEATADSQIYEIPIFFSAAEPVTAADFKITVSNGQFKGLVCGGDEFVELINNGTGCVVYYPGGGTLSGVLGTVKVTASDLTKLKVGATGQLSTPQGTVPADGHILGVGYSITQTNEIWFVGGGVLILINLILVLKLIEPKLRKRRKKS